MFRVSINQIYDFCKEIFPINRSITGSGVRETLSIIQRELTDLKLHTIPTGEKCFDWRIPMEWNVIDAYIVDPDGKKICNFKDNNLHLMGYSIPINMTIELGELEKNLHSLPGQPNAIPYITSYYKEEWGFCLTHNQRKKLKKGVYTIFIDSSLNNGELTYGELLIKGDTKEEIFFSTYICHPSMGNNEVSGPSVVTYLSKYILSKVNLRYSYRIIFIPETIGSIAYLSKNLEDMKQNLVAGFNVTCVGDDNNYSFMPSKNGSTLSDKVALHVLKNKQPKFKAFSFLERGSDERQYCSPGVDLPVCSIMRTKYGEYDEYHTSLDDLNFISPSGLNGAYEIYSTIIDVLENNYKYTNTILCEPQLGRRGMYPNISTKNTKASVEMMMNLLTYCDGELDLVDIAELIQRPAWNLFELVEKLEDEGIIKRISQ
jgi:aminopeptidase-like protein